MQTSVSKTALVGVVTAILLATLIPTVALASSPTVHTKIGSPATGASFTRLDAIQFTDGTTTSGCSVTGWLWTFGDGTTSTSQNPTHTYGTSVARGGYNVSLRVTAPACNGGTTYTISIYLQNLAPVAALSAPASATTDDTVTLDASASHDADGSISSYTFSIDGVAQPSQATSALGHVFAATGTHSVIVYVVDNDGQPSTPTAPQSIVVNGGNVSTIVVTPASATLEAGSTQAFTANATDAHGNPLSFTPAWTTTCGTIDASGLLTVGTALGACTATASAGTASKAATITVRDTTAPTLAVPPDATLEATGPSGATLSFVATATDTVDPNPAISCSAASPATFALGDTTVTCTATDASSNAASASFAVHVVDTTPPTLALPTDINTAAANANGVPVTFTATANDIVDGAITPACSPASGSTFAIGTTTVGCSATDAHANAVSGSFTITVSDANAPVLNLPSAITTEATGPTGAIVAYVASATDDVDGDIPVSCAPASNSTFALGTTTVNCSASDHAGHTTTQSFTVRVQDTTAPSLVVPTDITMEATTASGAAATFATTATDIVDGPVTPACDATPGAVFALGTTTVTCTATDAAGNVATGAFNVRVVDTTPPTLTVPSKTTLEATSATGTMATFATLASDAVDGTLVPTCTPASGSTFGIQTTTVTCSVADAHGNAATGSFTVTVVDTTPPTIAGITNLTAEATSATGAVVTFAPTASDIVDGAIAVDCTPASGATFAIGETTVSCTATDTRANSAAASFVVTVRDTTAPTISGLGDHTLEATNASGAVATFAPTASDAVDDNVPVTCAPASGSTFALGSTSVGCNATDSAGNVASGSFVIMVQDTTAPTLSIPSGITAEATSASGAVVVYAASASDLVDGTIAANCSPASGATFAFGVTSVTCTATDAAGNAATGGFNVLVQDTTPPAIAVPDTIVVERTVPGGEQVHYIVSTSDAVDGAPAVTCSPVSDSVFTFGETVVSCSSTDAHGNTGTNSFIVKMIGPGRPTIDVPANFTVEATSHNGAIPHFTVVAHDPEDETLVPQCDPSADSVFPLGTTAVTCTVTDSADNVATGHFNVNVVDTTAPHLTLPSSFTLEATGTQTTVTFATSARDTVDGTVDVLCTPASGSAFALGITHVVCDAQDSAGNSASAGFDVTVRDTTPPVFSAVADLTLEASSARGAVATFAPAATDTVASTVAVACSPASGSTFAIGSTLVSCTADDGNGNSAATSFQVRVADTTAPTLLVPADLTREATGATGAAVTYPAATAADAVDSAPIVSCSPASGSTFAIQATTITCTATDATGNVATSAFKVTVVDTTPPTVRVPAAKTVEATGPSGAVVTYTGVSASDIVSGAITPTCSPASGSTFALGTNPVTCTAMDAHGNSGTASFNVIVRDTTKPVLTVPANMIVAATSSAGALVAYATSATDLVSGPIAPVCAPASGAQFAIGTTTVSCTATDAAGNAATKTFTVRVTRTLGATVAMDNASYKTLDTIQNGVSGSGVLTWSYGAHPAGASVTVTIANLGTSLNALCSVATTGVTDAAGVFHFAVKTTACNLAGDYRVVVQGRSEGVTGSATTSFTISIV